MWMKLLSKFHLMAWTLDILVPKFFLEWEQKEDAVEAIKVEEGFLLHQ